MPVQQRTGSIALPATPLLTSSPTIGVPTSPLPTNQSKIPQHLAPDRPASFSCCVLFHSEWLNTTAGDHLPTPKIPKIYRGSRSFTSLIPYSAISTTSFGGFGIRRTMFSI